MWHPNKKTKSKETKKYKCLRLGDSTQCKAFDFYMLNPGLIPEPVIRP